jgi:hypothetical protein
MNKVLNISMFLRISLFVVFLSASFSMRADWINLTGAETSPNIAEIYVLDDRVKLVLEVYVDNLDVFELLLPDDWLKEKAADRPSMEERLREFSENKFQFVTENGEKLPAEIVLLEPRQRIDRLSVFAGMINPYTRQRVPEAPADKRVLYVELSYPFEVKPKELTIVPPADGQGRALVSFGFIAYHKSVPIIDFRYLGSPAKLALDWDDPWYSKFENRNLKRHHKSALMTYLYVEPYEVRHEVLTRVKDLEAWMELGLRGDEYIEIDELDGLRQRIGEFFLTKNPLTIDGKPARPILDRTNYIKLSLKGIQLLEKPERLEISTAIVGVIISYITEGMPQQVSVDWQLFTDQVQQLPATATDPAGPFLTYITPDDNTFGWTNYLKNYTIPTITQSSVSDTLGRIKLPLATFLSLVALLIVVWWLWRRRQSGESVRLQLVLVALLLVMSVASYPYLKISLNRPALIAGELSPAQATELLQVLLKNVYRAFDFREEDDVYDKLALSVDGDLLEDIYLQNRKSFSVQQAGGAQAKIKSVDVMEASATRLENDSLGYAIKASWSALGTVGHWGHLHQRKNQYDAIINVEDSNGIWKITGMELLEEQRVDPVTNSASVNNSTPAAEQKSN